MIITYNGIASDSPEFGIRSIMQIVRPMAPGYQSRTFKSAGANGVKYQGKDRDPLEIEFRLVIKGDTHAQKRQYARNISAWLDIEAESPLIFSDEPEKRYMAVLDSAIIPDEIALLGFADVTFTVPSSYAETITPKTSPRTGTNHGTAPALPIITVTVDTATGEAFFLDETFFIEPLGASFTHGLRLNYIGKYLLLLSNDLEPGDVVVFDVAKRLVTVNGLNARQFLEIGSSWKGFALQPGAFEITTEPAEGLIINVSYRERWK